MPSSAEDHADRLQLLRARVAELERRAAEHRRVEEALRKSGEHFRRMFDQSPIGAAIVSLDHRFERVNAALCRLTGYTSEELMAMSFPDITHPDDRTAGIEASRRLESGRIDQYALDMRYLRRDGRVVWVRLSVRMIREADGRPLHFLPMMEDITEWKRAIDALQESEQKFRAIADYSYDLECWIGTDGRLIWLNPAVERFTGYTFEECLAMPDFPQPLIHEEDRARMTAHYRWACEGSSGNDVQYRLVHRNGSVTWMSASWQSIFGLDGSCLGWRSSHRDITDRKRAEQQRLELLHISRLGTLGEMASQFAHELNQPLTAILSYASASSRSLQTEGFDLTRLTRNLGQVVAQATRAGEIIRRIRAFAQRRQPCPGAVDVNAVIHEALGLLAGDLRHHEIHVTLELVEPLPPVLADSIQLEQVLLNLIRNAIEAMEAVESSRRKLTLRTWAESDDAVKVVVSDTGPGVPPEMAAKVFDPFFTTKANGLGIGLSITRSIIEFHRGRLSIDSAPGSGCTFAFTLPNAGPPGQ